MKKKKNSVKKVGYSESKQMFFINGKMKFRILKFMDGMPIDEFYMKNLDPITALQDGHCELLDELNQSNLDKNVDLENDSNITIIDWDDPPF